MHTVHSHKGFKMKLELEHWAAVLDFWLLLILKIECKILPRVNFSLVHLVFYLLQMRLQVSCVL